ncbi:MAG TPA: pyridoxamine 5'-phosphate oxidase family protein [Chitinophaga sp.]
MLGTLNEQEIEEVLLRNVTGRIGCYDGSKVYVVPVSYAYNDKYIITHSYEGMKINIMRKNPQVCFEVDEMQDQANWRSVIAWGTYEEVTNERERYYAMKFLVSRLMHLQISETARLPEEAQHAPARPGDPKPIVYRIRLGERTGRFEARE